MSGEYINEEGDLWIERGIAPWPKVRRMAAGWGSELSDSGRMTYVGIEKDVRVSDSHEAGSIHGDDDGCADYQGVDFNDPAFEPCCRDIEAYHFRAAFP